jgi:hypothetical protein
MTVNSSLGPDLLGRQCPSRREFLARAGSGFGLLALASLLERDGMLEAATTDRIRSPNPLGPKPPHFAPRANSVIFLFMSGGPSHVDLFDPKPELIRLAGQPIPESFRHLQDAAQCGEKQIAAPAPAVPTARTIGPGSVRAPPAPRHARG